jgi:spermidine/putrescine transport system ATP-binding protein
MPKTEIKQKVGEALALVRLDGFEKRSPNELSGGQRQRVAVARAIINRPKALLLDEPLGALDLQLRRQLQGELKRIQKQLGISFVYITHDQEEALAMSDRVAVMRNGVFEQVAGAAEVYKNPKTAFVAGFVGNANLISINDKECFAVRAENITLVKTDGGGKLFSEGKLLSRGKLLSGGNLLSRGKLSLNATVMEKSFSGGLLRITAVIKSEGPSFGGEICASIQGIDSPFEPGDDVELSWLPANAVTVAKD